LAEPRSYVDHLPAGLADEEHHGRQPLPHHARRRERLTPTTRPPVVAGGRRVPAH
jgi:hypothetical protein